MPRPRCSVASWPVGRTNVYRRTDAWVRENYRGRFYSDEVELDWTERLSLQVSDHWGRSLRPRLAELTDAEYNWEPVPAMWSVRRSGTSSAPQQFGAGELLIDGAEDEPDPPPLTTISWRLGHLLTDVLGSGTARHFGGPPIQRATYDD